MTELERLLSQDNCCLVSVASIKKALEQQPCEDTIKRNHCPYRHENGNCLKVGGFCTSVDDKYCLLNKNLEPCENAINIQAAIDIVRHECGEWKGLAKEIVKQFNGLPPVQPKPKVGHWIFDEILDRNYYCSECKSMGVDYWDYCPYCGCRMVEPQESEDKE